LTVTITLILFITKQLVTLPISELRVVNSGLIGPSKEIPLNYSEQISKSSIAHQLLSPSIVTNTTSETTVTPDFKKQLSLALVSQKNSEVALSSSDLMAKSLPSKENKGQKITSSPVAEKIDLSSKEISPELEKSVNNTHYNDKLVFENSLETVKNREASSPLNKVITNENPYAQQISTLNQDIAIKPSKVEKELSIESNNHSNIVEQQSQPIVKQLHEEASLNEQIFINTQRQHHEAEQQKQVARLIDAVDPKYPSVAKRKGIELEVFVNFTIDKYGKVKNIEFEHQSRLSYFKKSITSAMKQWQFEPARVNGKPVSSTMAKIFSFNMA